MRRTEFWERMREHLGAAYAESYAHDQALTGLGGLTVDEAFAAGEDTKVVWRAVVEALELPDWER